VKLLVNAPSGEQQLIEIRTGGGYFDPSRVLWDTRTDGPLPTIQLGGMVRVGNTLQVDAALLAAAQAAQQAKESEAARLAEYDQTIRANTIAAAVAAMTDSQYDTWWALPARAAQKDAMLKFLVRAEARRRVA
jgi:hypothetical protein